MALGPLPELWNCFTIKKGSLVNQLIGSTFFLLLNTTKNLSKWVSFSLHCDIWVFLLSRRECDLSACLWPCFCLAARLSQDTPEDELLQLNGTFSWLEKGLLNKIWNSIRKRGRWPIVLSMRLYWRCPFNICISRFFEGGELIFINVIEKMS